MTKSIEQKIDGLERRVEHLEEGIKEISQSVDTLAKITLKGFERLEHQLENIPSRTEIQSMKLEIVDRYAKKETVADHELRLQELEA